MSYDLPDDKLNRKEEVSFLQNYLTNRYELKKDESFVLNINAQWGYGKTYFLKSMEQEFAKEHKVIYFDAWKNDFTKEPLLAFIATLTEELKEYFETKDKKAKAFFEVAFKSSLPLIVAILSKQLTGCTLEELEEFYEEEKDISTQADDNKDEIKTSVSSLMSKATEIALKEHNSTRKSIDGFVTNMKKLLEKISLTKKLPLFILIDELDRCRPNYAIELLENIKHLFDIPGIVFIVATDSKQLSHSINAVYGEKFASERYLKRFFDQEYTLKEPDKYEYCKYLFDKEIPYREKLFAPMMSNLQKSKNMDVSLFKIYAEYFNLGLRDIKQCINTLLSIVITWVEDEQIHLLYILFFIMLKQKNNDYFEECMEIVSGEFIDKMHSVKILNENDICEDTINEIRKLLSLYEDICLFKWNNLDKQNKLNRELISCGYGNIGHVPKKNIPNSNILKKYSNMVLNAGQLK